MKKTLDSVRQYINEGVYDPGIFKAFFLAGGPGSGKSFVTANAFAGTGLKLVNSDVKFEKDLRKAGMSMKMPDEEAYFRDMIRKGAKQFAGKQLDSYLKGRLGVIVDSTGRDYGVISSQVNMLKHIGYDCYMVFVNTSLEIAMQRNLERDRVVPEKIVRDSWQDVQQNLGGFQRLFGRNFIIVDNSKKRDEDSAKDFFDSLVKQGINKFVKAPVKNRIGINWMKRAKLLKKQGIK